MSNDKEKGNALGISLMCLFILLCMLSVQALLEFTGRLLHWL